MFRKYVTNGCHKNNEERLREQAEGKAKCGRIIKEEYEKNCYVSEKDIEDVRKMYQTRYSLLPFAGYYSNSRKYERTSFLCRCKEARE